MPPDPTADTAQTAELEVETLESIDAGSRPLVERTLRESPWAVRQETASALAGLLKSGASVREAPLPEAARSMVTTSAGVAVIPLRGLITARSSFLSLLFGGGGGLRSFRETFRDAVASDDVTAILLDVDSPGGSTDLVAETAAEIRAARGSKPITAIANTDAASAAYWIAAQADELVVTPSGEVGSIGVFILHWDESGLNEQLGIDPTYVYAGRYKVEGNPDEPLSDEAKGAFQQVVDEFYDLFVADVAEGRGTNATAVRAGFGEGRMVTARRAVELGMADRVDTYEATVARLVGRDDPTSRRVARQDAPTELAGSRALRLALPRRI